ncbi:MAG: alkaline phosphatase family protein [Candidatus Cybelea sp.]
MLSGCGGAQPTIGAPGAMPQGAATAIRAARSENPIQHIVVMVQESRTFNDLFVTTKVGDMRVGHGKHARTVKVRLKEVNLSAKGGGPDGYRAYRIAYRDGHMDGFSLTGGGELPYQYVNPADIQPYITLAADYGLADRMFQTQGSGDFTAHQDLIRGGTAISSKASVIDSPSNVPWGCPAPAGTRTNLINTHLAYEPLVGPFPCFTYNTLGTLFDQKSLRWKYYTPAALDRGDAGAYWNAFLAIAAVFENKQEWDEHISTPEKNILSDIARGKLRPMSWVIPDVVNSDRPGFSRDNGPAWVASVVNAIGESSYWNSTAVVIIWDDWGGFYDPIAPPKLDDQGGPGFRVPMIVVSPYVPQGELSHTVYGFGSIIRFIEDTWNLGRLGTTDEESKSIGNMFNFKQSPRPFVPIQ